MNEPPADRSYRALLAVPTLGRLMLAMMVARVAGAMVGVAMVLFTLTEYGSPELAGLVTFVSIFPGLALSPIAGALLDRHGRVRLVMLDYAITLVGLVLVGLLSALDALPPPLLVLIATAMSLTGILSVTGVRSLFPLLAPPHLWERVNAIDSNGYVVATILGPPIAAGLVALLGGSAALVVVGLSFGLAALTMVGIADPQNETATTGNLLLDAWQGLQYTWRNRTLRGLGFSISALNLAGGMGTIVVPLIVLDRLGQGETAVGLVFAVSGLTGMVSALWFGRHDTRGREWRLLVLPMLGLVPAVALMIPAASGGAALPGGPQPLLGLALLAASQGLIGLLNGPMDIALFTIRQRRTDPAWMGRAFAVSMAFNFTGFPIGAAIAGIVAASSIEAAIMLGIVATAAASVIAATMVPRSAEAAPIAAVTSREGPSTGPAGPASPAAAGGGTQKAVEQ